MGTCRVIANAESLSKVIQPIRSRCLQVRVPAPQNIEITNILNFIASREVFNLPPQLANSISFLSKRNLRRAIMMLQTCKLKTDSLSEKTQVPSPEYEQFTREICKKTMYEQSPKQLKEIRGMIYSLLTKGITPEMIFGVLTREFIKGTDRKGP